MIKFLRSPFGMISIGLVVLTCGGMSIFLIMSMDQQALVQNDIEEVDSYEIERDYDPLENAKRASFDARESYEIDIPSGDGTKVDSITVKRSFTASQLKEHKQEKKKQEEIAQVKKKLQEIKAQTASNREKTATRKIIFEQQAATAHQPQREAGYRFSPIMVYHTEVARPKLTAQDKYAPFGSRIKCRLVNTIDSSQKGTPIIALVTEDFWHDGKLIFPAGTEIHGKASGASDVRDRIFCDVEWVVVWKQKINHPNNGKELRLNATALHHEYNATTRRYTMDDGTAGLKGKVIKTTEYAEFKLYVATYMQGAAQGLGEYMNASVSSENSSTVVDSTIEDNGTDAADELKVSMAEGIGELAELYASRVADAIARDGVYIRVPAGQAFYLYAQETILLNKATLGGSVVKELPNKTSPESHAATLQNFLKTYKQERIQGARK